MKIALLLLLSACTLKVDAPAPNVTIDCLIVELPTGRTVSCDGGPAGD